MASYTRRPVRHALSDIYTPKSAHEALPCLRVLKRYRPGEAFESHLEETQAIERLDALFDIVVINSRMKCVAMEGLIDEGKEVLESVEEGPVRDAALISAAQKVEHYEIACYGTLCALGKKLGYGEAVRLLAQTLKEEKATDQKLTMLAEQGGVNEEAKAA